MGKVIKRIFGVLLALFFVFVVVRIIIFDASSVLSEITPTENAKAAYATGGRILTHGMIQKLSDDGYTRAYSFVCIDTEDPDKFEIQVTVKYNMSIYDKSGTPKGSGFGFKLYNTEFKKEYFPTYTETEEKGAYGYCRVVFDGVTVSGNGDLEIVMSSKDYTTDYSVYKIHETGGPNIQEFVPYKLSKHEKELLGE